MTDVARCVSGSQNALPGARATARRPMDSLRLETLNPYPASRSLAKGDVNGCNRA